MSFHGLSVLVNGTAIPLYVVAGTGGQINVVLPSELGTSGTASVEVMTTEGSSAAFRLGRRPIRWGSSGSGIRRMLSG